MEHNDNWIGNLIRYYLKISLIFNRIFRWLNIVFFKPNIFMLPNDEKYENLFYIRFSIDTNRAV